MKAFHSSISKQYIKKYQITQLLSKLLTSSYKLTTQGKYRDMVQTFQQNWGLTGCSEEVIITGGKSMKGSGRINPMLKLYVDQPVMINQNKLKI